MTGDNAIHAVEEIHALLDGQEWSADTTMWIAEVIVGLGLKISEP